MARLETPRDNAAFSSRNASCPIAELVKNFLIESLTTEIRLADLDVDKNPLLLVSSRGNEGGAFFILKCRHILLLLLFLSCETLAFQFTISFLRSDSKQFDASSSFLDSFRVFRQFPCILTTGEYLSLTSLINLKKKSLGVVFFELRNAPDSFSCAEFYSASRIDRSGYDIRICKFRPEFLQPVLQPVKVFKLFFFVINYRQWANL